MIQLPRRKHSNNPWTSGFHNRV